MGLNSTKGYDFSGSFCSWKGVFCDAKGEYVVKLEASGLDLNGVIPDNTIGKLKNLEFLDLSNNKITGLSSDFWSLSSLKNLNLSFNQISGILPSNIGNFGQLQSLDLSFNNFSGSIPEAISSLLSLQVLNLSTSGFESVIPLGISQCRSMISIDLSRNKLNGSLPSGFGAAFPKLRFLNLAENEIRGRDSDFSGMALISYLNLSSNLFNGSVVGVFKGPLEVIDLSSNQFQGHISQVNFLSSFNWSRLVYLDLSENEFSGHFSTDLNLAENLKHLNLAHNRFIEQPFLQIDMLSNLEYLNLSGTNLIGEIPNNISHMSSLRTLDLSKNHLSNHIPQFNTKNLRVLDVSYNDLTGEIPLMLLQELQEMESFNFSYNKLSFCASKISPETIQVAFIGSVNSCPIAANPAFFKRKAQKHRGLELALALTLSMTDSTTWVADVKQVTSLPVVIFEKPLLNFTFADLLSATSHFDPSTLLAEGRFGPVYAGLLPGGIPIAVKVLVHGSTMTDQEAARELEYLGQIKHPNLVPLTGYCLAGEQRIAIYDCMENGNLQNLLYDLPLGVQTTEEDWSSDTCEENENNVIQNVGFGSEGIDAFDCG
ncbi:probable LRR receptor-like serine threonine-kinase At2g24230 [Olea europaea subsp. europaea]|uniref:Probable LRR receptor-like serine threonine-kinase At2g24230 n=1 Tax=Olea europaea subsp. europaea TaxID=158383 RepID=A0A8S0TR43_OLEEU|nr:probable LRR receptor-like serine threonine-kinase At2g24230 [Olea europaea subsp. europaea]